MALVVFLRGVNVGGYRRFRPSELAKQLKRYDVVNIGAAGTFVVRKPPSQTRLRAELKRRLPFETEMMICDGKDITRLAASNWFSDEPPDRSIIQFLSILAKPRSPALTTPFSRPADGDWMLKVLHHENQFVIGMHRREMKAIGELGRLGTLLGVAATTRSWTTIQAIARILNSD